MSRSPYFFVERYNPELEKYELQHPFVWNGAKTELVPADLFPYNGAHELFSIVSHKDYSAYPEMSGIHTGLPNFVCEEISKEYQACWDSLFPGGNIEAHWFTYADLYIYLLEHPTVADYAAMDEVWANDPDKEWKDMETIHTDNPLFTLKNRIDAFFEVIDDWSWKENYSLIRIVYWIL